MTKKVMIIMMMFILAGCEGMTRSETIAAVKECEEAGMTASIFVNGFTNRNQHIQCRIKQ